MKKPLVCVIAAIAVLTMGGAAFALDGPMAISSHRQTSTDGAKSAKSESDTESETDSDAPDVESETDSDAPDTESDSGKVADSSDPSASSTHPDNHGAAVSAAAHDCPKDGEQSHGECVSAVAHKKDHGAKKH